MENIQQPTPISREQASNIEHLVREPCLAKQLLDWLSFAIAGHIKRAFLDFVGQFGRYTHCLEDARVKVFDDDAVLERFARAFVGGDAIALRKGQFQVFAG